jgi:CRISPR type IV-associated protein Csf3
MENLKITLKMRTPIAFIGMIHLDAVIMSALIVKEKRRPFDSKPYDLAQAVSKKMPLELVKLANGKTVYAGSVGFATGHVSIARWKKKWDEENDNLVTFREKKERIEHKRGFFKQYDMPLVILSTPEMTFYARGDAKRIEIILRYLTHIGKKSSQGFGEIREKKIEVIEQDWSLWRDGQPMRAIPIIKEGCLMLFCGYRFPYWDRRNQDICIVPKMKYDY